MPITKAAFKEQYERALARVGQLKELGKTDQEIIQILSEEKFYASVISKIFKLSGPQLAASKMQEDAKLAEKTFGEAKDAKKPVREKEIEDAAWFHNLCHDLGKYVYHKLVQYVDWKDDDMTNPEHAAKTLMSYIDTLTALIEDSGKVQTLEDAIELLEIKLTQTQLVLDRTVSGLETMKWYNEVLISGMPPTQLRQVFDRIMLTTALRYIPDGMVKAKTEAAIVE